MFLGLCGNIDTYVYIRQVCPHEIYSMGKNKSETALLKRFGENVRNARLEKDWSQADLAGYADIDLRQVGRVENATVHIKLLNALKIAKSLGVTLDKLIG